VHISVTTVLVFTCISTVLRHKDSANFVTRISTIQRRHRNDDRTQTELLLDSVLGRFDAPRRSGMFTACSSVLRFDTVYLRALKRLNLAQRNEK